MKTTIFMYNQIWTKTHPMIAGFAGLNEDSMIMQFYLLTVTFLFSDV